MQKKPASFFRDSVRHVLLRSSAAFSDKDTYALLGFCPGLVSFVVVGDLTSPALLPIIQWMPQIRKWGGSLKDLFGSYRAIDLSHPFFRAVTHLDIFDVFPNNDPRIYDQLAALPVCTHLCLNGNVAVEVLQRVLEQCPHLQVLVNLRHAEDKRVRATVPVPDMRLVVLIYRDYWSDWEVGARGGIDFWAAADAFVERKRRGDIDHNSKVVMLGTVCDPLRLANGN
ncbi:hypothetical protein FB451DRAFT_1175305 [Mycena latifolia]|nr:hypothetical protein FB451DRAFT_1175305 [Mycena latifolia]